ncbi:DUF2750 domain-containing protein [Micromonospora chersina]|uniref:DUF2750 domain-containing protein n=1 Tax=Micromonospora chersina TaxID=47854 RepID=UPI00368FB82F
MPAGGGHQAGPAARPALSPEETGQRQRVGKCQDRREADVSVSAAQSAAFRKEAPAAGHVWTVLEDDSYVAPHKADGSRAMPFWSRQSRAQRVVDQVPAYSGLEIVAIPFDAWLRDLVPWLAEQGVLIGVNWSGERATGYDVSPQDILGWFAAPAGTPSQSTEGS